MTKDEWWNRVMGDTIARYPVSTSVEGDELYKKLTDMIKKDYVKSCAPYGEMCRDPDSGCIDKGYCPLDPTCGD